MFSFTEENYLKTIYHLGFSKEGKSVQTNELAEATQTKAASVTDMLKKLAEKELIFYKRYQGVTLTERGQAIALKIIRKHRLWEVFLVEKLGFKWDEIHEIAEDLEHIESTELTDRLDHFLGNPKFDPHGDPIPDAQGFMPAVKHIQLSEAVIDRIWKIQHVSEDSAAFLQHLDKLKMQMGSLVRILDKSEYDGSLQLEINNQNRVFVTNEVAQFIWVI